MVVPGWQVPVLGFGAAAAAVVFSASLSEEPEELVESGEKISRSKEDCERTSSSSAEAASERPVDETEEGCSVDARRSCGGGNGSRGWMVERLGVEWECEPNLFGPLLCGGISCSPVDAQIQWKLGLNLKGFNSRGHGISQ